MCISLKVFDLFHNVKKIVEKNKDLEYLNNKSGTIYYKRQSEYTKTKCGNIALLINNHYFTMKDYIVFLFDYYFFNDKLIWNKVSKNEILECKKRYTEKELNKAKTIILDLKNKTKIFKSLNELYKIDEIDGSNILYELIKDKKITSYFYVKFYLKVKNEKFENSIGKIKLINNNSLYLYKVLNNQFKCIYIKE